MQALWQTHATLIIGWIFASMAVSLYWRRKGKGAIAGFVLSLILSPVIGLGIALIFFERGEDGALRAMKGCPSCGGMNEKAARSCGLCGRALDAAPAVRHIPTSATPISQPVQASAQTMQVLIVIAVIALLMVGGVVAYVVQMSR